MTDNRRSADLSTTPEDNDYLARLIQSVVAEPSSETEKPAVTVTDRPHSPDMISSLLSNPELLSKLPSIIAAVKPIMEIMGSGAFGGTAKAQEPHATAQTPQGASIPVGINTAQAASTSDLHHGRSDGAQAPHQPSHHSSGDRRAQLLCALKPYLCEDRRRAIDYVIKLDRLGDVLKSL